MLKPSFVSTPFYDHLALVARACDIAHAAGQLISKFAGLQKTIPYRVKADLSPVTDADEAANELIIRELANLTHATPVVAEESIASGDVPAVQSDSFWLVDPLDGTKEFIGGRDEYTVNIALIEKNVPVIGVIYLPAINTLYWGGCRIGAFRKENREDPCRLQARIIPAKGATVVVSRSHITPETKHWLSRERVATTEVAGSSLKFCRIAEGAADLYPRLGPTMEWDIAAGHAILMGAGGRVETIDGTPLHYGKPGFKNPYFVARGC